MDGGAPRGDTRARRWSIGSTRRRTPRCAIHAQALAGWRCDGCAKELCPDCVAPYQVGYTELLACVSCRAGVRALTEHRSAVPYVRWLLGSWRFMVRPDTLFPVAMVAALLWATSLLGPLASLFFLGVYWSLLFHVLKLGAEGADEFRLPDFRDVFSDVLWPALLGAVGTAFVWAPPVFYVVLVRGSVDGLAKDPVFFVLCALGFSYAPMALMAAASDSGLWRMLNVVAIAAYIRRLGKDYLWALLALAALLIPWALLGLSSALLPRLFAVLASALVPFWMARILGLLLYVRGDAVGYGPASDYQVPLLPGATPRGVLAPLAEGPSARPQGIELLSPDAPAFEVAEGPQEEVLALLEARRYAEAFAAYRAREEAQVSPDLHVRVAQHAAGQKDLALAVRALEAAAKDPGSPVTPRALVILARIYAEQLDDRARAEKLYAQVSRAYPQTPAGRFALEQLHRSDLAERGQR